VLNRFQALIAKHDVARKNRYKVQLTNAPLGLQFTEDMALMCESIEFPGQNMTSTPDQLRYGLPRESITAVTYASITATFICSPDMKEKKFFEAWQRFSMNLVTYEPRFYQDYVGEMKIAQLDKNDKTTYEIELFEVYPKTVTAQDLGYATNDAYHTVAVELMYHHWTPSRVTYQAESSMKIETANVGTQ
jgi:hypothetical protein|tara:strand:- start:307 stop:876 length:570 start_codon:yes stop_codon:yes gene_type:complete